MNCEQAAGLITDRLKGLLTDEEQHALEAHLGGCDACRDEAAGYAALWRDMGRLNHEPPRERVRARFYAALAAREERGPPTRLDRLFEQVWPRRPVPQAAVAAGLLVAGIVVGRVSLSQVGGEIERLRRDVQAVSVALLDHQSASERLLGVEWSRRAAAYEPVASALLDAARNDNNVNVRLAAIEALGEWADRPEVGAALSDALSREQSPLVQITLAEMLLDRNASGSVTAVRQLVDRAELDPGVREHLLAVLADTEDTAPATDL